MNKIIGLSGVNPFYVSPLLLYTCMATAIGHLIGRSHYPNALYASNARCESDVIVVDRRFFSFSFFLDFLSVLGK